MKHTWTLCLNLGLKYLTAYVQVFKNLKKSANTFDLIRDTQSVYTKSQKISSVNVKGNASYL